MLDHNFLQSYSEWQMAWAQIGVWHPLKKPSMHDKQ